MIAADESSLLSKYTQRKTISSREIQTAVCLVLPRELGKHAIAKGTKAVISTLLLYLPRALHEQEMEASPF